MTACRPLAGGHEIGLIPVLELPPGDPDDFRHLHGSERPTALLDHPRALREILLDPGNKNRWSPQLVLSLTQGVKKKMTGLARFCEIFVDRRWMSCGQPLERAQQPLRTTRQRQPPR